MTFHAKAKRLRKDAKKTILLCVNFPSLRETALMLTLRALISTPMTYRRLSAEALAERDYDGFLTELHRSLTDGKTDPNEVVRDTLFEIYYGATRPDPATLSLA